MVKKSFTLFEIIVSLILLGIVVSFVLKILTPNKNIETYYKLQSMENKYNETSTIEQSEEIKFQTY